MFAILFILVAVFSFDYAGFFSKWHESDKKYGIHAPYEDPEQIAQAWQELQSVPSYFERHAKLRMYHTTDYPFCDNLACSCHDDTNLLSQYNGYVQDGLLTVWEFLRTINGKQI